MNIKVQFSGHLAADADVTTFESGKKLAEFSVSTKSKTYEDGQWNETVQYHTVKLPGSDKIYDYLKKGKAVEISGHLEYKLVPIKDTDKSYKSYFVVANEIELGASPKS